MISKLTLKFGTGPGHEPLAFTPGALTIFVGPNNSGKSQLLRDIARYVTTPNAKGSPILRRVRRRIPRGPVQGELLARIREELELFIGSKTDRDLVPFLEKALPHIFKADPGHFAEDTAEARELIQTTVIEDNFVGLRASGDRVYQKVLETGAQIWVYVREGTSPPSLPELGYRTPAIWTKICIGQCIGST